MGFSASKPGADENAIPSVGYYRQMLAEKQVSPLPAGIDLREDFRKELESLFPVMARAREVRLAAYADETMWQVGFHAGQRASSCARVLLDGLGGLASAW